MAGRAAVPWTWTQEKDSHMAGTVICAHRGLDDQYPENTLIAFEAALKLGMAVEFDLNMSADRRLMVIHDDSVDRTTNGKGRVAQMTLAQIKELDAGVWKGKKFAGQKVPTFDEALGVIADHAKVDPVIALDVKLLPPGIISLICESLDRHGLMSRTVGIGVIRMSVDVRRRFLEGSKDFQCSVGADTRETLAAAANDPYSSWVYGRFVPTADDIKAVHAAGKKLFVSGDAVSNDVKQALAAVKANPEVVLTWHPTELNKLAGR
jgi:glycerophosphoryl diester phosphodiesterase